jgi:hypothetical protein
MALTPLVVDELSEQNKKLLELWMKIKLVFLKAFAEGEITREQEGQYLQLKSEISRIYRVVSEKLPVGLKYDGDKMMDMLKNAMTMEHLQQLPAGERQTLNRLWHQIYIKLTRTLGALDVMKSGYYPHLHRARFKSSQATAKTISKS